MEKVCNFFNNIFGNFGQILSDKNLSKENVSIVWNFLDVLWAILLFIILFVVGIFLITQLKKITFKVKSSVGFFIFLAGCWIYFIDFNYGGCEHNIWALTLRSCMSSLEMFISKSDLIGVNPACRANHLYMTLFSTIHALAIAFSGYVAISYFGVRFSSKLNMLINYKLLRKEIKELNVFIGYNELSYTLAGDWHKKSTVKELFTLFVNNNRQESIDSGRISFGRILETFSSELKREIVNKMREIHASMIFGLIDLSDSNNAKKFRDIGIEKVDMLYERAKKVNVFVLSENINENVNIAVAICKILEGKDKDKEKKNVRVYCQARREAMNNIYESVFPADGDTNLLQIVDNAYLSINYIKNKVGSDEKKEIAFCQDVKTPKYKHHPINYVDIDHEKHVAKTPFSCMVIGFGDTGKEAFKFLYEMGQLPTYETPHGWASGFRGYIVDKEIETVRTLFYLECPALKTCAGSLGDLGSIEFMEENPFHTGFWTTMEQLIKELNFIVIALGNDDQNMRLAVLLAHLAGKKGRTEHFDIFVRSYEKKNELKLEEVAGLYPHIHVFGKTSELYGKAMFEDMMLKEAKKFENAYNAMYQLMQPKVEQAKSKCQKGKKKEPTKLEILYNKIRSNSQNLANAYHRFTKLMLLSEINKDGNYVLPEGLKFALSECKEKQHKDFYNQGWEEKNEYTAAVDKVAQCEHLRWWAAHVCLGYVPMDASEYFATDKSHNEVTMQHACMIPWQELSKLNNNEGEDKFKAYDRLVVAVTCDRIEGK